MFCAHCGQAVAAEAAACGACGKSTSPVAQAVSPGELGQRVAQQAKQATQNALIAFRTFAINPVGGLRLAIENLGARNALGVAFVFALVFDLCLVLAVRRAVNTGQGMLAAFGGGLAGMSFGTVLKLLFCGLIPFAAIFGAIFAARKIFKGNGSPESDAFIAGAALLPPALLLLVAGLLGLGNLEVVAILGVFALCYTILIIHTGCREICAITEPAATIAVPLVLLVSSWFSKIILAALL